mgnify:CR=1 FL=1
MTAIQSDQRQDMLCKVPEITLYFWIIKVFATTVGETAADFLNINLGFGLTGTSWVMGLLLIGVLAYQMVQRRYIPWVYWLTVILISIVGTLISDNLTDNIGVPLWISTVGFSALLGVTFLAWYAREKTLSIHSIFTTRRELFYWAAILFTFALGTAGGDFTTESLQLGYLEGVVIFSMLIMMITLAYYAQLVGAVLAFWVAYILTRPLGASIGDLLTQAPKDGGFGLSHALVNLVFFVCILGLVGYLTISKVDQPAGTTPVAART